MQLPEFPKRTLSALSEFSQGTCGFIGQAVTRGELIAAATPYTPREVKRDKFTGDGKQAYNRDRTEQVMVGC